MFVTCNSRLHYKYCVLLSIIMSYLLSRQNSHTCLCRFRSIRDSICRSSGCCLYNPNSRRQKQRQPTDTTDTNDVPALHPTNHSDSCAHGNFGGWLSRYGKLPCACVYVRLTVCACSVLCMRLVAKEKSSGSSVITRKQMLVI